jgi:hypothetical protein
MSETETTSGFSRLCPVEERKQGERDDGENQHRNLQVGVGDDRLCIQFEEPVSGVCRGKSGLFGHD